MRSHTRVLTAVALAVTLVASSTPAFAAGNVVYVDTNDPLKLLEPLKAEIGADGVFLDSLDAGTVTLASSTVSLHQHTIANGATYDAICVNAGESSGSWTVRWSNCGRTSDGAPVDLVIDFSSRLVGVADIPTPVYLVKTKAFLDAGGLNRTTRAEYPDGRGGTATTATVHVYEHGTLTSVHGKLAMLWRDLDGASTWSYQYYSSDYDESIELVSGVVSDIYTGTAGAASAGHRSTELESSDGETLRIDERGGRLWLRASHSCNSHADSSAAFLIEDGATLVWRGFFCGSSLGLSGFHIDAGYITLRKMSASPSLLS